MDIALSATYIGLDCLLILRQSCHDYAQFIQQIQGQRDKDKSHQVGRGDDRRDNHYQKESMTAVTGQQRRSHHTHPAQNKGYHGQLEHKAHGKGQGRKRRDVAVERYHAVHAAGHTVSAEEAERDGKQHVVAHKYAEKEKGVDYRQRTQGMATLAGVKRRGHEAEQLVQDVGRRSEKTEVYRGRDMAHELARKVGGYEFHMVLGEAEAANAGRVRETLYPAVGHEPVLARGKEDAPRCVLEAEYYDGKRACHSDDAEQHAAELLEMSAEGHETFMTLTRRHRTVSPLSCHGRMGRMIPLHLKGPAPRALPCR